MSDPAVPIDYTTRDFAALKADLVAAIPSYLPEWTNRSESDFGIVMIELFSHMGDILGYYIDRIANEAFISTAVQRASVLSLAKMIDYRPAGLAAASVTLTFTASASGATVPAGTQVTTVAELGTDPVIFETDEELVLTASQTDDVTATEGVSRTESSSDPVGVSSGSPDQVFSLYYSDIIEDSITISVDEDDTGPEAAMEWRFITHLLDAGADERVYTTATDENSITYVVFGDDINGRIPTQGAVITATYRTGLGDKGNVGANTLVELVDSVVGVDSVDNSSAASGGADVESIASIRKQAPRSLKTLNRATTIDDYALLAEKTAGVLHAKAESTVYTNVILYIVPAGGGAPSTALKDAVINDLADVKMINTTVTVNDPVYVGVNVTVNPLNVLPKYNQTTVETAVTNALTSLFEVENVDFGYRVTLSQVYQAIQSVEGVDYAVVTELNRTGTGLADVVMSDYEVPEKGTITITATGGLVGS